MNKIIDLTSSLTASDVQQIARLDGHDQAGLICRGELPDGALSEVAKRRIAAFNPAVNAVVWEPDVIPKPTVASGPMLQVPYLLKASAEFPDFPLCSGSRSAKSRMGRQAAPFFKRLAEAGLVPVGMTSMPEFGLLSSGESILYGPTKNPWSYNHSTSGSSSGAAAAVACGMVPFAHASDAAGSIRMPASSCGVIGFKASRDYNLRARPHHFVDDYLCSDTLIARSMRDVNWATHWVRPASVLPGEAPQGKLKIAMIMEGLNGITPDNEVNNTIRQAATQLEGLGYQVDEVRQPLDTHALGQALGTIWCYLGGDIVDSVSAVAGSTPIENLLEPWTLGLHSKRESLGPSQLSQAFQVIVEQTALLGKFHQQYNVILSPVNATVSPLLGHLSPCRAFDELWAAVFEYMSYTPIQNLTGTPSISLPMGQSRSGIPIGVMLSADFGQDDTLLKLATEMETKEMWQIQWPANA